MYQQNQGEQMTAYNSIFKEKNTIDGMKNQQLMILLKYSSVHSYYYFRDKNFLNNLEKIINIENRLVEVYLRGFFGKAKKI